MKKLKKLCREYGLEYREIYFRFQGRGKREKGFAIGLKGVGEIWTIEPRQVGKGWILKRLMMRCKNVEGERIENIIQSIQYEMYSICSGTSNIWDFNDISKGFQFEQHIKNIGYKSLVYYRTKEDGSVSNQKKYDI